MNTQPPAPMMTLEETIQRIADFWKECHITSHCWRDRKDDIIYTGPIENNDAVCQVFDNIGEDESEAMSELLPLLLSNLPTILHHLETGKRLREAVENLRDQKGRYNTGAAYEKLMALLSPQTPQQPSPPAPYYTADGQPLQYHEVSGGGGCGAIPVEPPKQEVEG